MMAFIPKVCAFQKSGASSTLPSKKYQTQPFIGIPLCAKKFARLGRVKEENGKIASSWVNNLIMKAVVNRKTFSIPNVGTNIISRREHCIPKEEEDVTIGWVRVRFVRNRFGQRSKRRERQMFQTGGRSWVKVRGDEDSQCGQRRMLTEGAGVERLGLDGGHGEPLKVLSERMHWWQLS